MKKDISFHIGCSGFYNWHWKKIFYPEKMPQRMWFDFYSRQFNTVELNVTFYRFPTVKGLRAWFDKSPDDFKFSVKAPKLITHMKKFDDCDRLINDLYSACEQGLGHKLGCILFQLPPGIHYNEDKLVQVVSALRPGFKNVVEFRHKSWWTKKVYDKLSEHKITFCSVDHPSLPPTIIANTPIAYIRLHGSPKMFYSKYTSGQLNELHTAVSKKRKIKEAYIYFNNTAGEAGVLNALELQSIVMK